MEFFLFYFFSGLTILSALGVIFLPKPTRALLSLIVTMFSLAVVFLTLGAAFVAMVHIIVYAGAVLVLFLFVIMLQGIGARDEPLSRRFPAAYLFAAFSASFAFLAAVPWISRKTGLPPMAGIAGSMEKVGDILFKDYLVPFELASLLLLLGVFAAIALAGRDPADRIKEQNS